MGIISVLPKVPDFTRKKLNESFPVDNVFFNLKYNRILSLLKGICFKTTLTSEWWDKILSIMISCVYLTMAKLNLYFKNSKVLKTVQ